LKALHPIRSYRKFKARCAATRTAVCSFCLDTLAAIRALTGAINTYDLRVSELHAEIKKIEGSVGYLHRAERRKRESQGQKVNV